MADEEEVIRFLREKGEATLEEISSALKIPKYGPRSAYEILYSLKSKNIVERKGGAWILTGVAQFQAGNGLEKLARAIKETIAGQQAPIDISHQDMEKHIKLCSLKSLIGFRTETFLDKLFFGPDGSPLGGIPSSGQFALIGPLGSGKSLLANEIALKVASSKRKTLLVILDDIWESDRIFDLRSRMKIMSSSLQLNWDHVSENIYVLNPTQPSEELLKEYEEVVGKRGIELAVMDSVNHVELGARKDGEANVKLLDLISVNRAYGVTGIFVIHDGLIYGGYKCASLNGQLLHVMDCIILMAPIQLVLSYPELTVSNIKGIERLRVVQVARCRLCGFENKGILISITRDGLIRPLEVES